MTEMVADNEAVGVTRDFEVTAEELVRTLQRRGIPLPSEIGAFVVLEACEQIAGRPADIRARDVLIADKGDIVCEEQLPAASERIAVVALLRLLADLLVGAAPGVPNMLLDLVEHGPNDERLTLALLRSELEACLLPLNRSATRRVLARLVREVRKAAPAAPLAWEEELTVVDVDAAFDELLGGIPAPRRALEEASPPEPEGQGWQQSPRQPVRRPEPGPDAQRDPEPQPSERETRPPPRAAHRSARQRTLSDEDAVAPVAESSEPATAPRAQQPSSARSVDEEPGPEPAVRGEQAAGQPEPVAAGLRSPSAAPALDPERAQASSATVAASRSRAASSTESVTTQAPPFRTRLRAAAERPVRATSGRSRAPVEFDAAPDGRAARGRLGLWVFVLSTAGAVALLLIYFAWGRDQSRDALGFLRPTQPAELTEPRTEPQPARAYGDLRVNSEPDRAQVFLLIGPGPALATDIPLGVAQEFVALADGHRPARALLPADAVWDDVDGEPRYELAIQAPPLRSRRRRHRSADALGPTLLPQSVGTPVGRLGSVRVVTTPRAAHVYQLIGFTPDVHVDNLPLDHAYELLVYVEGRPPVRRSVEPEDFQLQAGKRIAQIDVTVPTAGD